MPLTLGEEIARIDAIFGERNARTFDSPEKLLALLGAGIRLLEDAYEEGEVHAYAHCLASIFSRWAACMIQFEDAVEAMASKYASNCAYCSKAPCACPKIGRPAEKKLVLNRDALQWSLGDWQTHLNRLYGARNRERGMDVVLRRLFSEHSEALSELLMSRLPMSESGSTDREALARNLRNELCDVLAWTLGAANVLNIDLMTAVTDRYGAGCPTCKQPHCACRIDHHHGIKARTVSQTP